MARPPFYKTAEELQTKIDEYFDSCGTTYVVDDTGKMVFNQFGAPVVKDRNPPTVTGLALHLGFSSRQSLINYQSKKAFVDVISRAKLRVENFVEKQIYNPEIRPAGVTFVLMNMGWANPSMTKTDTIDPEVVAKQNRERHNKLFGEYGGGQ